MKIDYRKDRKIQNENIINHEAYLSKFILDLDGDKKEEIALSMVSGIKLKKLYWLELILSAIIATLGLLNNSVAVIIGAMLIAPLFIPIQSLSFGIINSQHKITWKSLKNIILSILIAIIFSWIFAFLIPSSNETSEMIARINPNILDLFIAIFSAIIAFLSILYKKELSMGIAGVAMSASLLPPLAVVGIELHLANYVAAWGSFLLFLTNIVAIIFTGIWLFFFFGFGTYQEDDKKIFKRNIVILAIILVMISVPLITSVMKIKKRLDDKEEIRREIVEIFKKNNIKNVKIYRIESNNNLKDKEEIFLGLKIPEGVNFYKNTQFLIREKISKILKKDINLEVEILRIAKIETPSDIPEITKSIKNILEEKIKNIEIFDLKVFKKDKENYKVKIIFAIQKKEKITEKDKNDLEEKILEKIFVLKNKNTKVNFNWVNLEISNNEKNIKENSTELLLNKKINDFIKNNFDIDFKISKLVWKNSEENLENKIENISNIYITLDIFEEENIDKKEINILKGLKEIFKNSEVELNLRIFKYERKKINLESEEKI